MMNPLHKIFGEPKPKTPILINSYSYDEEDLHPVKYLSPVQLYKPVKVESVDKAIEEPSVESANKYVYVAEDTSYLNLDTNELPG